MAEERTPENAEWKDTPPDYATGSFNDSSTGEGAPDEAAEALADQTNYVAPAIPVPPEIPAATTKTDKLKGIKWSSRGRRGRHVLRCVKMFRPICRECSEEVGPGVAWWVTCPHNPYFMTTEQRVPRDTIEVDDDGRMIITGTTYELVRTVGPNIVQVPAETKVNSGFGVLFAQEKGFKFPEELGFKPMCQAHNCWSQELKFRTRYGDYCTRDEAALQQLRERGTTVEILDGDRRREQIESTPVTSRA